MSSLTSAPPRAVERGTPWNQLERNKLYLNVVLGGEDLTGTIQSEMEKTELEWNETFSEKPDLLK